MTWAAEPTIPPGKYPNGADIEAMLDRIRALSNGEGINNAGAADTTTSASYANLAGTSSFSFTKVQSATRLKIELHATCYTTVADTSVRFAVLINGTDYDVAQLPTAFTASSHAQVSGIRPPISSIAAGTYVIQGRWRRVTGTGTLTRDANDWLSICCTEVG